MSEKLRNFSVQHPLERDVLILGGQHFTFAMHSHKTPFYIFFSYFLFPQRGTVQKFYRCAQDFIDVQSHQISLQITVNRGLTKETSLPAHSYFAPPLLATARQETPEFSF